MFEDDEIVFIFEIIFFEAVFVLEVSIFKTILMFDWILAFYLIF